jgi:hypothetical protein
VRSAIFFYDLPDGALPGVVGDLHHAPTADERINIPAAHVPSLCNVTFCHNSSGFLAAAYAG